MLLGAALLTVGAILLTLFIRSKDIPPPEPVAATAYLEERKARIYEGLRDLQFEYRVGKLSDADYAQTKRGLQEELAKVMAEIDAIQGGSAPPQAPKPAVPRNTCPHCGKSFKEELKFCGACGKPMAGGAA